MSKSQKQWIIEQWIIDLFHDIGNHIKNKTDIDIEQLQDIRTRLEKATFNVKYVAKYIMVKYYELFFVIDKSHKSDGSFKIDHMQTSKETIVELVFEEKIANFAPNLASLIKEINNITDISYTSQVGLSNIQDEGDFRKCASFYEAPLGEENSKAKYMLENYVIYEHPLIRAAEDILSSPESDLDQYFSICDVNDIPQQNQIVTNKYIFKTSSDEKRVKLEQNEGSNLCLTNEPNLSRDILNINRPLQCKDKPTRLPKTKGAESVSKIAENKRGCTHFVSDKKALTDSKCSKTSKLNLSDYLIVQLDLRHDITKQQQNDTLAEQSISVIGDKVAKSTRHQKKKSKLNLDGLHSIPKKHSNAKLTSLSDKDCAENIVKTTQNKEISNRFKADIKTFAECPEVFKENTSDALIGKPDRFHDITHREQNDTIKKIVTIRDENVGKGASHQENISKWKATSVNDLNENEQINELAVILAQFPDKTQPFDKQNDSLDEKFITSKGKHFGKTVRLQENTAKLERTNVFDFNDEEVIDELDDTIDELPDKMQYFEKIEILKILLQFDDATWKEIIINLVDGLQTNDRIQLSKTNMPFNELVKSVKLWLGDDCSGTIAENLPNPVVILQFYLSFFETNQDQEGHLIVSKREYRMNVVTSSMFEDAISNTVTVGSLSYSLWFPSNCRLFESIPTLRGSYMDRKDQQLNGLPPQNI